MALGVEEIAGFSHLPEERVSHAAAAVLSYYSALCVH